jgi:FkbM family methyltransferase
MSISNFIINLINNRRSKIEKNYPGSLGAFFKDGGNDLIYKKLNLNPNSIVIDGGGFEGEFIDNVLINYGCKIESFEPLQKEFDELKKKYFSNERVEISNLAIFSETKKLYLNQEGISSSIVNSNLGKNTIKINAIDIVEIIKNRKNIDLLKLNVEGAEYEIMNRIIDTENLETFNSYLIQYHKSVKQSGKLRDKIRNQLLNKNYKEIFNYDFVWEYWRK